MDALTVDWTMDAGETRPIRIALLNPDGTPAAISAAAVELQIWRSLGRQPVRNGAALLTRGTAAGTLSLVQVGDTYEAQTTLAHADTVNLTPGSYYYELHVVHPSIGDSYPRKGLFEINRTVIRP